MDALFNGFGLEDKDEFIVDLPDPMKDKFFWIVVLVSIKVIAVIVYLSICKRRNRPRQLRLHWY
ncbi:TPA_asm: P6 [Utricularia alphacytorhabdovirus 1]|nr:TPA_asm: P6 [Utricularia alphacytorhabdovirus 1]